MLPELSRTLIGRAEVASRVGVLGKQLAADLERAQAAGDRDGNGGGAGSGGGGGSGGGAPIVLVPVMTGAMVFTADLIRCMPLKLSLGLVTVSSYPGTAQVSKGAALRGCLPQNLGGAHVVLIDDILDSGRTLGLLRRLILEQNPASLRIVVLLRKDCERAEEVPVDYIGFDIPDAFVVGYGLDYDDHYRNLPEIAVLNVAAGEGESQHGSAGGMALASGVVAGGAVRGAAAVDERGGVSLISTPRGSEIPGRDAAGTAAAAQGAKLTPRVGGTQATAAGTAVPRVDRDVELRLKEDVPGAPKPFKVIGLAGGIGAGKSEVANLLADLGYVVVDSDKQAKAALDRPDVRGQLVQWWGPQILGEDGKVNRKAVADVIFSRSMERKRLEGLVHPIIKVERDQEKQRARAAGKPGLVIDAPLLYEAGLDGECDEVLFVDAPRDQRAARVKATRGWSEQELARREKAQWSTEEKKRLASAVIVNDKDRAALKHATLEALEELGVE